jgi:hypothetical protein
MFPPENYYYIWKMRLNNIISLLALGDWGGLVHNTKTTILISFVLE